MKMLLILSLVVPIAALSAQDFEGWITYRTDVENPNPKLLPDSAWQQIKREQFGERGYMESKIYYKKDKYVSKIDAGKEKGFQAYNPKDKVLYSWRENSDTVITINSKKNIDEFVDFAESNQTDTILGIPCKSIILNSKFGKMAIWYNPVYFRMDAKNYPGHLYGHWEKILQRIGCIPLRMDYHSMMTNNSVTAIAYKQERVEDHVFEIPKFKTVIEGD